MKSLNLQLAVGLIVCGVIGAAHADEPSKPAPAPFPSKSALSDTALGKVTGRDNLVQRLTATNTSTVSHNAINGPSTTGEVSFDGNALQNLHGLAVLSTNTGNNVSINASLNVNIAIHP